MAGRRNRPSSPAHSSFWRRARRRTSAAQSFPSRAGSRCCSRNEQRRGRDRIQGLRARAARPGTKLALWPPGSRRLQSFPALGVLRVPRFGKNYRSRTVRSRGRAGGQVTPASRCGPHIVKERFSAPLQALETNQPPEIVESECACPCGSCHRMVTRGEPPPVVDQNRTYFSASKIPTPLPGAVTRGLPSWLPTRMS